jgi:RNA polymerase sigma-70 factor (ECF subfamily)
MDEKQVIAGCLQGNLEEFKKIVDTFGAPAMAMAMNILRNRADAEDTCQEAFIQVYRNLHAFDASRSLKNWIYTIVYRRCLDHLKRRRRSIELMKKMARTDRKPAMANPGEPAEPESLPSHLLERLNAKERTALCLWANDGYSSQEISEVLRCSAGTARVYLYQARKKIKGLLEHDHVSLQDR